MKTLLLAFLLSHTNEPELHPSVVDVTVDLQKVEIAWVTVPHDDRHKKYGNPESWRILLSEAKMYESKGAGRFFTAQERRQTTIWMLDISLFLFDLAGEPVEKFRVRVGGRVDLFGAKSHYRYDFRRREVTALGFYRLMDEEDSEKLNFKFSELYSYCAISTAWWKAGYGLPLVDARASTIRSVQREGSFGASTIR